MIDPDILQNRLAGANARGNPDEISRITWRLYATLCKAQVLPEPRKS